MPSTNKTPNYGLNLWAGSDRPTRADFNKDNQLIDAAIKAAEQGLNGLISGWIPAGDVWTYVSATQFTVPGDQRSKYGKGNPLIWSQNGTVRYSNIIAVPTYNAGTNKTTVTKHGGYVSTPGDCDLLNTATYQITNNYYSKSVNPQGFPPCFNYVVTITAGSGAFGNASGAGKFSIINSICEIHIVVTITTNGTAVGAFASLPINVEAGGVYILAGREDGVTGLMLQGKTTGGTCNILKYDGNAINGNGYILRMDGRYCI